MCDKSHPESPRIQGPAGMAVDGALRADGGGGRKLDKMGRPLIERPLLSRRFAKLFERFEKFAVPAADADEMSR